MPRRMEANSFFSDWAETPVIGLHADTVHWSAKSSQRKPVWVAHRGIVHSIETKPWNP